MRKQSPSTNRGNETCSSTGKCVDGFEQSELEATISNYPPKSNCCEMELSRYNSRSLTAHCAKTPWLALKLASGRGPTEWPSHRARVRTMTCPRSRWCLTYGAPCQPAALSTKHDFSPASTSLRQHQPPISIRLRQVQHRRHRGTVDLGPFRRLRFREPAPIIPTTPIFPLFFLFAFFYCPRCQSFHVFLGEGELRVRLRIIL